jgi:hypothetical protein
MLKEGAWHDDGKGHRLLIRETEDLRIAYAGPLQMGAEEMPEEMKYFAAAQWRIRLKRLRLPAWQHETQLPSKLPDLRPCGEHEGSRLINPKRQRPRR